MTTLHDLHKIRMPIMQAIKAWQSLKSQAINLALINMHRHLAKAKIAQTNKEKGENDKKRD